MIDIGSYVLIDKYLTSFGYNPYKEMFEIVVGKVYDKGFDYGLSERYLTIDIFLYGSDDFYIDRCVQYGVSIEEITEEMYYSFIDSYNLLSAIAL